MEGRGRAQKNMLGTPGKVGRFTFHHSLAGGVGGVGDL